MIDDQLRAAGWRASDSAMLRHASGARPDLGEAVAIAEWPTGSEPVDYALFVDGRCVGVVEAKRQTRDVPGRLSSGNGAGERIADADAGTSMVPTTHVTGARGAVVTARLMFAERTFR